MIQNINFQGLEKYKNRLDSLNLRKVLKIWKKIIKAQVFESQTLKIHGLIRKYKILLKITTCTFKILIFEQFPSMKRQKISQVRTKSFKSSKVCWKALKNQNTAKLF